MEKFTAIYNDCWMAGSHMQTLTCYRRFELIGNETIQDAMKREGIEDSTVIIFNGWPSFQGEEEIKSA